MKEIKYTFYPVGQGCFFSAQYVVDKKIKQTIVYDCGTVSPRTHLNKSIIEFRNTLQEGNRKKIDILIISHFDRDHVNGVLDMLKEIHCDVLIMPYISVFERLIIFAKWKGYKNDEYASFLKNPVSFVRQNLQVNRIILLDGGPEDFIDDENSTINIEDYNFTVQLSNRSDQYDEMLSANEPFNIILAPAKIPKWQSPLEISLYIRPIDESKIKQYADEFKKKFTFKKANELFEPHHINQIRELGRRHYNDLNASSVCVGINIAGDFKINYDKKIFNNYGNSASANGIILNGDSRLVSKKELDRYLKHFQVELDNALIFQLPHHGSQRNILMEQNSKLWNLPTYIVNHGRNRKLHPHINLLRFIKKYSIDVRHNTEDQPFYLIATLT